MKEDKLLLNGEDTGLIARSGNIYYDGDDLFEVNTIEDLLLYFNEELILTQTSIKQILL